MQKFVVTVLAFKVYVEEEGGSNLKMSTAVLMMMIAFITTKWFSILH